MSERQITSIRSEKKKKTLTLLCVFGGFLGLHCFYAGKFGRGFAMFFTMGGCCVRWIMDIVVCATGNFTDAGGMLIKD